MGSIGVGVGNVLISVWIKLALFYMIVWIYNLVPWRMELNWWTAIPCYIIFDFFSYWAHNISHRQRFWWATHVAHHSGEHYNLSVSFRLSWVQYLKVILLFPLPLMGFHPIIFFVVNQVAILFNFGFIRSTSGNSILLLNTFLQHLPIIESITVLKKNISTKTMEPPSLYGTDYSALISQKKRRLSTALARSSSKSQILYILIFMSI